MNHFTVGLTRSATHFVDRQSWLSRWIRRGRASLSSLVATAAIIAGAGLAAPAHSSAQMRMGMGGAGFGNTVGVDAIDEYAKILQLTKEQKAAVTELHLSYQQESAAAMSDFSKAIQKLSTEFQEEQDPSVFQKKMPEVVESFKGKTKKVEDSFLSDVKVLLTNEQAAKWPVIERAHLRRKSLPGGLLAGESVDVYRILESAEIKEPYPADIQQALDRYSNELDGALKSRNSTREAIEKKMTEGAMSRGIMNFDMEAMKKDMLEMRKVGIPVRSINDRFASMIQAALPADKQSAFQEKHLATKFPQVYGSAYPTTAMTAATEFDDATPEQKKSIEELKAAYERDVKPYNQKWSSEIAKAEQDGEGDEMMANWARMMSGGGGGDDSDATKARKARRGFDKDTIEKLKAILTESQRAKLPEREPDNMFGGGMQIRAGARAGGGGGSAAPKEKAGEKSGGDKGKK